MKIVIDARYLSKTPSGIGVYSEQLLRHLAPIDTETQYTVIVHASFDRSIPLGPNFELVPLDARPVSIPTLYAGVDRILEEIEPNLFHATFPLIPLRWEGPTLVTVHDLQPFTVSEFTGGRNPVVRIAYDLFYRWAYQRTFNTAQTLVAVSHYTKERIDALFPLTGHRTLVVPSGLDDGYFAPLSRTLRENVIAKYRLPDRYLLYVGSTRPNKNLPRMLQVFADYLLETSDPDLRFVLVLQKDRFFADCRRIIERSIPEGRVLILEQIPIDELRVLYACAQALFFVTSSEGFGFPVLEAQASGLPVLAGNDAAVPLVAGGDEAAVLLDPLDSDAMLAALKRVLTDQAWRSQLAHNGLANCQRYTWAETARRMHDVYRYMFDPASFEPERREAEAAISAARVGGDIY